MCVGGGAVARSEWLRSPARKSRPTHAPELLDHQEHWTVHACCTGASCLVNVRACGHVLLDVRGYVKSLPWLCPPQLICF